MKLFFVLPLFVVILLSGSFTLSAQAPHAGGTPVAPGSSPMHKPAKQLFIDVHQLGPGKVNYEAVAKAHAKDLAVEGKHGVHFIRYWVDESRGTVYCLSEAPDSNAIIKTHAEAHGLLPAYVEKVKQGQ